MTRNWSPPVKAMVDKLKAQGRTPAILLVYGIPLRVGPAPLTVPEMELKALAIAKVKEYQAQAVPLVHQLDRLTGALTSPPRLTYPTPKFLEKSQESLVRGRNTWTSNRLPRLPRRPGPRLRPS